MADNLIKKIGGAFADASPIISGASSLFGSFFGNKRSDSDQQFQAAENEKNRQFSKEMAEYQNKFNRESWMLNNEYNSPSASMARLRSAGINPDIYWTEGLGSGISPMSSGASNPSASGSVSPRSTFNPLSGVADTALQFQRQQAEIRNINADTENKQVENSILSDTAKYQASLLQGSLDLNNSTIKLNESVKNWNEQQIKQSQALMETFQASIDKTYAEIDQIKSTVALTDSKKVEQDIINKYKSKEFEAQIDLLVSQAGMNRVQAAATLSLLPLQMANVEQSTIESVARQMNISEQTKNEILRGDSIRIGNVNMKLQNDRLDFDLTQAKFWDGFERGCNIANDFINSIGTVCSSVLGIFK